ncbi:MAG TPA: 30S ribosomal protein S20, partial [Clostridia bacterium]|nr:30S ribosomal protein S20 [Clostridia bacterium]
QALDKGGQDAQALLREASRTIDKVASKGAIHWKTAARKKSRIAKAVARQQKAASETR